MDVAEVVAQAGGTALMADLRGVSRRQVRNAVEAGALVRAGRGIYVLPSLSAAQQRAAGLSATVSGLSAALMHGWPVLREPRLPEVTVPVGRKVPRDARRTVRVHWADVTSDVTSDVTGRRTSPLRTVIDCARWYPFPEALAVADSALRSGSLTTADLVGAHVRGAGAAKVRRVLESADAQAANPFESGLRAAALSLHPGFVPQPAVALRSGHTLHPDVGLPARRLALEADSFEFHGQRQHLVADCWRYNELVVSGWTVLRFSWEHVMRHSDWVADAIGAALRRTDQLLEVELAGPPPRPQAA